MVTPRFPTAWLPLSDAFGALDDRDGVPGVERVSAIDGARVSARVAAIADAGASLAKNLSRKKIVPAQCPRRTLPESHETSSTG